MTPSATPPTGPMTAESDDLKLVIAHTIIEDLRTQHPGIEPIDNARGDIWLPGGSTPQSAGCIIDIHSVAQAVEQQVRATLTPGHTDLMISPESIDAFLDQHPLSRPQPEASGEGESLADRIAAPPPVRPDPETEGLRDIAAERRRQVEVHGWTPEHDDTHTDGAIANAAADFAGTGQHPISSSWAYGPKVIDKEPRRQQLVKAGALIVAEIARLDRQALQTKEGE